MSIVGRDAFTPPVADFDGAEQPVDFWFEPLGATIPESRRADRHTTLMAGGLKRSGGDSDRRALGLILRRRCRA